MRKNKTYKDLRGSHNFIDRSTAAGILTVLAEISLQFVGVESETPRHSPMIRSNCGGSWRTKILSSLLVSVSMDLYPYNSSLLRSVPESCISFHSNLSILSLSSSACPQFFLSFPESL